MFLSDEAPGRAASIHQALEQAQLGSILPPEDFGDGPILATHSLEMVAFLQSAYDRLTGEYGMSIPLFPEIAPIRSILFPSTHPVALAGIFCHSPDSPILAATWDAAYWSAQCALTAARRLLNGAGSVFALTRPPGHHAMSNAYGGFCYLNNLAIAARYLQSEGHQHKIAILDIDYHHGNGTQEIFYSDPGVLFCSLHVDPASDYPYFWGNAEETGEGPGDGYTSNWPLPPGCPEDDYLAALFQALDRIVAYQPQSLLVSFGADLLAGDPLGGFDVSMSGLAQAGAAIAALGLPTLIGLEGGYNLETLGKAAVVFLENFAA